jgi:hypothetical protein
MRPDNLSKLKPGTKYVVIRGRAVPITGIQGRHTGDTFYPNGGDAGYAVRTVRPQPIAARARPGAGHCGQGAQDWR